MTSGGRREAQEMQESEENTGDAEGEKNTAHCA
jgi:hypothetical protein